MVADYTDAGMIMTTTACVCHNSMHGLMAVALWLLSSDLILGSGVLLDIHHSAKLLYHKMNGINFIPVEEV